jgi:hypothetical protein
MKQKTDKNPKGSGRPLGIKTKILTIRVAAEKHDEFKAIIKQKNDEFKYTVLCTLK